MISIYIYTFSLWQWHNALWQVLYNYLISEMKILLVYKKLKVLKVRAGPGVGLSYRVEVSTEGCPLNICFLC